MKIISADDIQRVATWPMVLAAMRLGHKQDRAAMGDTLLSSQNRKMLVRSAWIEGVAPGVKAVTVFPDNPAGTPPKPTVQGPIVLFDDADGSFAALLDGTEITKWKTAADSALGTDLLARKDVASLLMVGAGNMAEPLIRAHLSVRPSINRVEIWNRNGEKAVALAQKLQDLAGEVSAASDLDGAVDRAEVISVATMSETPIIKGALLRQGAHLDLVGAYPPTMREADDEALTRARIFVDCFDTTVGEIGEISDPVARGVISRGDVLDDFYGLVTGNPGRLSSAEITLFKNGGGAHLDIMTASAIAAAVV